MTAAFKALMVLLCSFTLVACSTLRVVADGPSRAGEILAGQEALFEHGDRLVLALTSGEKVALSFTGMDAEGIEGIRAGKPVRIATADIQRIEKREHGTAKTVLLVIAVVAAVVSLAQYAAAVSNLTNAP